MNSSRVSSSVAVVACATLSVLGLAACGSDADTPSADSPTATTTTTTTTSFAMPPATEAPAAAMCPTAPPESPGEPEWTLQGATGSVAVNAPTDTTAPQIDVEAPFSVTETQVQTMQAGAGPVVGETDTVLVCYMGVNGRDGTVFDSSYQRGAPVDFPLDGVVPGFQKAIAGQTVGSTVAVAMVPADGYPEGQPSAGIQPGDTLVFAIEILDAAS